MMNPMMSSAPPEPCIQTQEDAPSDKASSDSDESMPLSDADSDSTHSTRTRSLSPMADGEDAPFAGAVSPNVTKLKTTTPPSSKKRTLDVNAEASADSAGSWKSQPSKRARKVETSATPASSSSSKRPLGPSLSQPVRLSRRSEIPSLLSQLKVPRPVSAPQMASRVAIPKCRSSAQETIVTHVKGKQKAKATARKRSANYWHLDGSVVVQVQTTIFKLHRSRLALQSTYFAALFGNSGSDNALIDVDAQADVVDSCPVYIVKGVSVLDFERLLTALDTGIAYAITPPPFCVLASLVRAAHALSFKPILSVATHLLREMWPRELARIPYEPCPHAVETILLAQQCDVPEVLKRAYFELLRTPAFGQDFAVYVHAESAPSNSSLEHETDEDEDQADAPRLAASDLVRLVKARDVLQREWLALATVPPLPSKFPCPLTGLVDQSEDKRAIANKCAEARRNDGTRWAARLVENGVLEVGLDDVFAGIEELVDMEWAEMGYCMGCVAERRDAWMEKREKLWANLDVLLGLSDE